MKVEIMTPVWALGCFSPGAGDVSLPFSGFPGVSPPADLSPALSVPQCLEKSGHAPDAPSPTAARAFPPGPWLGAVASGALLGKAEGGRQKEEGVERANDGDGGV